MICYFINLFEIIKKTSKSTFDFYEFCEIKIFNNIKKHTSNESNTHIRSSHNIGRISFLLDDNCNLCKYLKYVIKFKLDLRNPLYNFAEIKIISIAPWLWSITTYMDYLFSDLCIIILKIIYKFKLYSWGHIVWIY